MAERIQLRRTKGWRLPENAMSVARPTRWGNPFKLGTVSALARIPAVHYPNQPWEYEGRISADGMRHDYHHPSGRITVCHVRYMTADEVVRCYRALLLGGGWPLDWMNVGGYYRTAAEAQVELAGRDLACWCPLNRPCHADVLLEIANASEQPAPASFERPI